MRTRFAAASIVLLAALVLLPALPAAALTETSIAFVTKGPVTSVYGGNWSAQLMTRMAIGGSVPAPANQATVNVFVSGTAAPLLSGLPIQADGSVYVTQPLGTPLPPGSYELTAVLVPVAGSYLQTSQTAQPLALTISAFGLTADVTVNRESVAAEKPVVELTLSGEYVDRIGTVPPGTWRLRVTSGSTTVLDEKLAQDASKKATLRVPLDVKLQRGRDYTVKAEFSPVESLSKGLDVTQASATRFRTRDDSLSDILGRDVPYPLWLLVLTALVPLGLASAAAVLTVRMRGRRTRAASAAEVDPETSPVSRAP